MALVEKKIIACIPDKVEACKRALRELITEDDEIVTLIAGEDVLPDELEEITSFLEREYEVEVEAHEGLQPVYSFIIGVE
jgi:dihydroxyacetone kinase-like predicted kinase